MSETNDNSLMAKVYLTTKETANYLGVSISYLYKLMHRKEIPYYKPTGKIALFKESELRMFVERTRISTANELRERAIEAGI